MHATLDPKRHNSPTIGKNTLTRILALIAVAGTLSLLLAVAVPMTFGAFTATTANTTNSFTAATLTMQNGVAPNIGATCTGSPSFTNVNSPTTGALVTNAAVLSNGNFKPGDTLCGQIRITNTGSMDFNMLTLSLANAATTASLATQLQLTITSDASGATTGNVYGGASGAAFGGVGSIKVCGDGTTTVAATCTTPWSTTGATSVHTFTFAITFPLSSGNAYQGSTATQDFVWAATQ